MLSRDDPTVKRTRFAFAFFRDFEVAIPSPKLMSIRRPASTTDS